jgi:molybdenum cofactor biosynthesis enzyme MoaA
MHILPILRRAADIAEIADFIRTAAARKPSAHTINDARFKNCQRAMTTIGG